MKKSFNYSSRLYVVVATNNNELRDTVKYTLEDLCTDDGTELTYSIQGCYFDDILSLNIGESLYIQPDRDDKGSKGVVLRVK